MSEVRKIDCVECIALYMRALDNFASYQAHCRSWMVSWESTHWLYSVPSGHLTRETFHSAWLGPTTRTLQAYPTEKKCAGARAVSGSPIVSSFKQLFMLHDRFCLLSIYGAPNVCSNELKRFIQWRIYVFVVLSILISMYLNIRCLESRMNILYNYN